MVYKNVEELILGENQVAQLPVAGFLYPAFTNRSTDMEHIDVFRREDK
jgi:hypothetical protein